MVRFRNRQLGFLLLSLAFGACHGEDLTTPATTGTLQLATATTGAEIDPDGYTIDLDGEPPRAIGASASLPDLEVAAGSHTVQLSGLAPNCAVAGENPRSVSLQAGATAQLSFQINCHSSNALSWSAIGLPFDFVAGSLWASSPSDIFVTGMYQNPIQHAVLHYNGTSWTEQLRGPLHRVWGLSPNNVFVVGSGRALHYDGSQWTDISPEDNLAGFECIWATSDHNVYAGGWYEGIPEGGHAMHYDGTTWTGINSGDIPRTYGHFIDMQGISSNDIYALGHQSSYDAAPEEEVAKSMVLHYDGTSWRQSFGILYQYANPGDAHHLFALWVNGGNDIFAAGSEGYILHSDGSSWQPMLSPTTGDIRDLWGASGSDVYAVGRGGILHYDGTRWSVINATPGTYIWGTSQDLFVVTEGAILHGR